MKEKIKIGIDIGGSHISIGVVNNKGKIEDKIQMRITKTEKRNIKKSITEFIINNVNELTKKYDIVEIGIALPGTSKDGVIITSGNLEIKNYPLIEKLQEKIKLPIYIKNDAKAAAIAEEKYGCLHGYDYSIFLTLGTGIGGAAFVQNKLLKGGKALGYEFGHMIIKPNGIPCTCGQEGCFERYASMKAFKTNLRNVLSLDETTRGEELLELIRKNNPQNSNYQLIEDTIEEFIKYLSIGIQNLIQIFEPEIIGLGGSFVYFEDVLLPRLKKKINRKDIIIKSATLGNDAGIIGATIDNNIK